MVYLSIGLGYVLGYAAIGWLLRDHALALSIFGDVGLLIPPVVVCAVILHRRGSWRGCQRLFWDAVGIGMALWIIGHLGWAFEDLGWALGLDKKTLARKEVSMATQAVFEDPGVRTPDQLERARLRAPKLHTRTIPLDGTPIFWGVAKPLVRARERGWGGRLTSADWRAGIPERFG